MLIKKAVCMHEEDVGTLWKHTEYRTGHSEVRRARKLKLSFLATIANYGEHPLGERVPSTMSRPQGEHAMLASKQSGVIVCNGVCHAVDMAAD